MNNFKTTDIVLAAYLKMNGHTLTTIAAEGKRGVFIFQEIPESVITNYDLGKAKVEPIIFNNTIKQLATSARRILDAR